MKCRHEPKDDGNHRGCFATFQPSGTTYCRFWYGVRARLRGVKLRVFVGDRGGWSRGFWYSQPMVNKVHCVIKVNVSELRRTPRRCDGYGSHHHDRASLGI